MKKYLLVSLLFLLKFHTSNGQIQLNGINNSNPIIYDINLSWNAATADTVLIEYSTDGITYTYVDKALTNTVTHVGNYMVHTENLPNSPTARIKVTNIHDTSDFAVSVQFYLYRAIVTYTAPQANAIYTSGQQINVSIGVVSLIPCSNTELYFSANNGYTWQLISSGSAANFTNFNWTAPTITSHHCLFGFWNGWNWNYIKSPLFSIINPANPYGDDLIISYPAGGEVLHAGDVLTVTWDTTAIANRSIGVVVREAIMPYNNTCMIAMTNSKIGHAILKVPYQVGSNYQVYIFSFGSGSSGIMSATEPFAIDAPYLINGNFLDIIQPLNTWVQPGSSITVNWQSYPGLTAVGTSRSFPGTNIPAVGVNYNNMFNTGHYTFNAPNQDSVDILVKLEPYLFTPTLSGPTCDAQYFITYHTSAVTSIKKTNSASSKISISPNPSHSTFQISNLEKIKRISIRNILGNEIMNVENVDSPSINVDLSAQLPGVYFLVVQNDTEIIYSKMVKE